MFTLADPHTEKRFNRVFLFLFICLFLLAPGYYQDNPGGEGLFLPFNNVLWIAASFLIGLGIFKAIHTQQFYLPALGLPMLVFPLLVTLMGLLMSLALPVSWLFRCLSIWGGVLLFFALNQFRLERRWQDNLLLVLVASGLLQSMIGLAHLTLPHNLGGLIPHSVGVPRGIFQQQNLNASYVATTLLVGIYALSLPSFRRRPLGIRLMIFIAIGLNSLIIGTSGSRLGILATLIGLLILLSARYRQLWAHRRTMLTAIAMVVLAAIASTQIKSDTGGLLQGMQKFERLTQTADDPTRNDVRWMIYASSLEMFLEKPLLGHGLGSFQNAWHQKKASYLEQHPEAAILAPRLSHPHNELLFWGIEGGLLALTGVFLVAGALLYRLWQLGWQRGGAYIALLTPITLHTQVELPLYISQLHWLVMIVFIALIGSHQRRQFRFPLSSLGRAGGLAVAMVLPVVATIFFVHSLLAVKSTIDFQMARNKDISLLEFPSRNIYFAENTSFLHMQTLLRYALQSGNTTALQAYVLWATEHLLFIPDQAIYVGLAIAHAKLGNFEQAYAVMNRGLGIYPTGNLAETGKKALNEIAQAAGKPLHY